MDLFASRLTHQLPRFFSWKPGPAAEATDALMQNWEQIFRYANPPWCLTLTVLTKIHQREGKGASGGPSMKDLTMVSVASRFVAQCSLPTTTEGGPGDFTSRKGIHHAYGSPTPSCMAIVREQCRSGGLSSTASQLVTASWRSKTTSSYESLFRKWHSWCLEQDRDPTRGPVVDIANFRAELFQQGYQYCLLNAYRSAISLVHEKVDGELVGQHPLISRVLKGVFNERPPKPKYQSSTWS